MRLKRFLILIIIFAGFTFVFSTKPKIKLKGGGISNIPTSFPKNYKILQKAQFSGDGCPKGKKRQWIVGKPIGCKVSPNGKFTGKFIFNGFYEPERYYELVIMEGDRKWTVFAGDYRTLGWQWTKDNRIKIFYNCGTGCRATKVIGLDESVSISNYMNGKMDEEHGWKVEFSNL